MCMHGIVVMLFVWGNRGVCFSLTLTIHSMHTCINTDDWSPPMVPPGPHLEYIYADRHSCVRTPACVNVAMCGLLL